MVGNQDSVEKERLIKLWEAYEKQEKEYNDALKKILAHEKELHRRKNMEKNMRQLMEEKNREITNLQLKTTGIQNDLDELLPRIEQKDAANKASKERYAKLYALTEELEEEMDDAKQQLLARDMWFKKNFENMEGFARSLEERKTLIELVEKGELNPSPGTGAEMEKLADPSEKISPEIKERPKVTFESKPVGKPEIVEEKEEPLRAMEKHKAIKMLCQLESLNPTRAQALYNSGFTTPEDIKKAPTAKLLEVDGFDELLIESLRIDLLE